MRHAAVPAKVTTVEDRIMGNLGLSQLVLLVLRLFVGAGFFVLLPPVMHGSLYKYIVIVLISILTGTLAIRIKGKIILLWLITIVRYNLRPKYYVFQKSANYREEYKTIKSESTEAASSSEKEALPALPQLAFHDAAYVLEMLQKPESNVRFETTKKGGLHVRLTEVQD